MITVPQKELYSVHLDMIKGIACHAQRALEHDMLHEYPLYLDQIQHIAEQLLAEMAEHQANEPVKMDVEKDSIHCNGCDELNCDCCQGECCDGCHDAPVRNKHRDDLLNEIIDEYEQNHTSDPVIRPPVRVSGDVKKRLFDMSSWRGKQTPKEWVDKECECGSDDCVDSSKLTGEVN